MRNKIILLLLAALPLLLAACADRTKQQETEKQKETVVQKDTHERTDESVQNGCDLLFFGDSITADSNFGEYFPERSVVNLGVYGDTLEDMLARVDAVQAANPRRIFLLGGINCLRPDNVERCVEQYRELLDALRAACPDAKLCVESVLPVGKELDPDGSVNDAVRRFNAALEPLAQEKGCDFADLYAVYERGGVLDPTLTRDGIHLNFTAYGPWADCIAHLIDADNQK